MPVINMKGMKILFIACIISIISIISVTSQNIDYTYPNDYWVDRILDLNQSGYSIIVGNITGDEFRGNFVGGMGNFSSVNISGVLIVLGQIQSNNWSNVTINRSQILDEFWINETREEGNLQLEGNLIVNNLNGTDGNFSGDLKVLGNVNYGSLTGRTINATDINASGDLKIRGSTTTKELAVLGNITISKTITLGNESFNKLWNGSLVITAFPEPVNDLLFLIQHDTETNHFWIQEGGSNQMSGVTRSFGIVNEVPGVNTTNITSCHYYMDLAGIAREDQIDCNTSTTGADLFVGDDIQVGGDIRAPDTTGEVHFITREWDLLDENFDNSLLNKITSSILGTTLNINSTDVGDTFVIKLEENVTILDSNSDSVTFVEGTNSSPVSNFITYQNTVNPILTRSATDPSVNHADVIRFSAGDSGRVFGSVITNAKTADFVQQVYKRFFDEGSVYISGFGPNVTATHFNISDDGEMVTILNRHSHRRNLSTEDYFFIRSNGLYNLSSTINDIDEYSNGISIGNNKYFNVMFHLVHNDLGPTQLMAVIQGEPVNEYTSTVSAEVDSSDVLNIFPSDALLKRLVLPIGRVVMKRSGTTNAMQELSNGKFFIDFRGAVTPAGSSPSATGITSHSNLDNLDFANAGHTGFASTLHLDNNTLIRVGNATNIMIQNISWAITAVNDSIKDYYNHSIRLDNYNSSLLDLSQFNDDLTHTTDTTINNCTGLNGCQQIFYSNNLSNVGAINRSISLDNYNHSISLNKYNSSVSLDDYITDIPAGPWNEGATTLSPANLALAVGIGTSSPKYALTVEGNFSVTADGTENPNFFVADDGNVGIGVTDPSQVLEVKHATSAQGVVDTSDTGGTNFAMWRIENEGVFEGGMAYRESNDRVEFYASNGAVAVMSFDQNLNVGIGETNPGRRLIVNDAVTSNVVVQFQNTATGVNDDVLNLIVARDASDAGNEFIRFFDDAGGALVGHIQGTTGDAILYTTTSDRRTKKNIRDLPDSLNKVMQLQPREFEWKDGGETDIGFIAQEMKSVYPNAVTGNELGNVSANPMGIDYGRITPLLVGAIQELKAAICEIDENNSICGGVQLYRCVSKDNLERECPGGLSGGLGRWCYKTTTDRTYVPCSEGWVEV